MFFFYIFGDTIKSKTIFTILLSAFLIITLACVSAADSNQTALQDSPEIGNFTELNGEIGKISDNGSLTLKKDYKYNSNDSGFKEGIKIVRDNIVIDGDGHTIDGAGQARIFNITSNNVTLKNIHFINGYSNEYGGAIVAKNGIIKDSFFTNNTAKTGGAIYFDEFGVVTNSRFENNSCPDANGDGGAVYLNGGGTVSNSIFTNNTVGDYAGAVYFNENGNVTNCNFTNNTASYYGGAVYFWKDGKIENSNFKGNYAQNGGSLYVYGVSTVDNCNFTANSARAGGAIQLWGNGTINHSIFTDNLASFSGGAIYSNNCVKLNNCNFTGNCAEEHAGGTLYAYDTADIIECNFTNNSASSGGAIYLDKNGNINKTSFKFNKANDGGAILVGEELVISKCSFKDNVATLGTNDIKLRDNAKLLYLAHLTILSAKDVIYGNTVRISANVSCEDAVVNSGSVSVVINNKRYSSNVVNGTATIEIPNLNAGSYSARVMFDGGQNYTNATKNVTFNILKQNLKVSASNKAYIINYGGKYSVTINDANNNPAYGVKVAFTLNGRYIGSATANSKGVATFKLTSKMLKTAKAGKRNLVIKTTSPNYAMGKTVKITINKEKTKITAKAKKFKRFSKTKKYTIKLKNSKAKAVKKVKVTLKIKGKTYKAKTNSKGKAVFKIKKLYKKGKFTTKINFKGNKCYKPAAKKVKIAIK
jgi:predicted outer membrane repeat protein